MFELDVVKSDGCFYSSHTKRSFDYNLSLFVVGKLSSAMCMNNTHKNNLHHWQLNFYWPERVCAVVNSFYKVASFLI